MPDTIGNPEEIRSLLKPENPYSNGYYEATKYNGQRLVDQLLNAQLTPQQVNKVLTSVYRNLAYDPSSRTLLTEEPNFSGQDPKFQPVNDWIIEVMAQAQDYLVSKSGVLPIPGDNDARTSQARPTIKYKSVTK